MPFIVRWPKGIKAGQKTDAMACTPTPIQHWKQSARAERTLEARMAITSFQFSTGSALRVAQPSSATRSVVTLPCVRVTGNSVSQRAAAGVCLRERDAQKQGLPPMQLFNLAADKAEKEESGLEASGTRSGTSSRSCKKRLTANGRCTP